MVSNDDLLFSPYRVRSGDQVISGTSVLFLEINFEKSESVGSLRRLDNQSGLSGPLSISFGFGRYSQTYPICAATFHGDAGLLRQKPWLLCLHLC